MKTHLLFPHKFRRLGYLLAIPAFILGFLVLFNRYEIKGFELFIHEPNIVLTGNAAVDKKMLLTGKQSENFTNELALTLIIVSLMLIAFSRLKREDELTAKIRLNALYWAILVNYLLYSLLVLFVIVAESFNFSVGGGLLGPSTYYIAFSEYNLFTPLIIFTGIFFYQLYRHKNEFTVNEVRYLPHKPYNFLGKWLSAIMVIIIIYKIIETGSYELAFELLPLAIIVWAYSKQKAEDEYIKSLRLEAMQIAVYVNYGILLITNFLVYGISFWTVQFVNLITIPFIFIAWFQYKLYRVNKQTEAKALAS